MADHPADRSQTSNPPRSGTAVPRFGLGIALMLLCVGFFSSMSATVKLLAGDYSTWQIVLFRNLVPLPIVFLLVVGQGGLGRLSTTRPGLHFVRNGFALLSNLLLFFGLGHVALADASAIQFTSPLFVTALSALVLGDRVGPRRWIAVFGGFCVIIVMVAPSGEVQWASLTLLASTLLYGSMVITTRILSRTDPTGVIFFYLCLIGTLVSAAVMPWFWLTPSPADLALLLLVGVFGGLSQWTLVNAVRMVSPAILAPFEYTLILWAIGFDILIWQVQPSATTLIGAGIIAIAGLYIAQRESGFATRLWSDIRQRK